MANSKSKIDLAGRVLASNDESDIEKYIHSEDIFDDYRSAHLGPLMQTTSILQQWMETSKKGYYIALRLKRKPQILRKLNRFHVRLSQLQDIAGSRIILDKNSDVDEISNHLFKLIDKQSELVLIKDTDYRGKGRDDSGYRARHIILDNKGYKIELQLRSKIQHYWAETIERTSVVYGYLLKELEGDDIVLNYFKKLSEVFFEFEGNRRPTNLQRLALDELYPKAQSIISSSDKHKILGSHPNRDIIKTLSSVNKKFSLNNWIFIFSWNTGNFVSWIKVSDPREAVYLYAKNEREFPAKDNFEVVLVGASDVSTIEQTHSHYFGIESYDGILRNLDESFELINEKQKISIGERRILTALYRRNFWHLKTITIATVKNHMCEGMNDFDESLDALLKKEYVIRNSPSSQITLNLAKKKEIDALIE